MAKAHAYLLYARKSTDETKRQVLSIDAQINEARQFAQAQGLTVIDELIETRSAKAPGRPIFNSMLHRIAAGDAAGIVAWHPDRLARNAVDSGQILDLLDTGALVDLRFPTHSFEATPQGKFVLGLAFSQSKYYIDSLAENSKRGVREKVRRGEYPSLAPFGYLNDTRTKKIVVDQERARLVRLAFKTYAGGKATLLDLCVLFAQHGILTKETLRHRGGGGKVRSRISMSNMLRNPIYCGEFRFGGLVHQGTHEAIVSKALFDQVQRVFELRHRWSRKTVKRTPKAYVGILRCGECGCAITAEIQKGHTYYRCSKKNKAHVCAQRYVREEIIAAQLKTLLLPYRMPEAVALELLNCAAADEREAATLAEKERAALRTKIDRIDQKLRMLQDDRLDGLIDRDGFASRHLELRRERKTLDDHSRLLLTRKNFWLEPFRQWVSDATDLAKTIEMGSQNDKRALILKIFGSNLVLKDQKARGEAMKPWGIFADNQLSSQTAQLYHLARTFFMQPLIAAAFPSTKFRRRDGLAGRTAGEPMRE